MVIHDFLLQIQESFQIVQFSALCKGCSGDVTSQGNKKYGEKTKQQK